ncbi:unnamed protein product, partial [Rotaria socialis]
MSEQCSKCEKGLSRGSYYEARGDRYCKKCYAAKFCKTCTKCGHKIMHKRNLLKWNQKYWHKRCFTCSQCNTSLLSTTPQEKKGTLHCLQCLGRKFPQNSDRLGTDIQPSGNIPNRAFVIWPYSEYGTPT